MSGRLERRVSQDDDICLEDYGEADHDRHATLRYNDIANAGAPARALDFPAPEVFRGERVDLRARDHKSGRIHYLRKVLVRSSNFNNKKQQQQQQQRSDTAYLQTKKISKTVYGCVNLCIVLRRIDKTSDGTGLEWESTDLQAAIKTSEWSRINELRGKHLEDPVKEIAAMQLLGNYHRHFAGALEVLQDDKCLYTVMPYLGGGDLYGKLTKYVRLRSPRSNASDGSNVMTGFDESSARIWFRQLLHAVNLLQKKGVCHRDICLENMLLDEDNNLCLIDPGLSLRVPYTDSETGGVGDVSSGTSRRLMINNGTGGKLMYVAPEIISRQPEVDAFATDLWSVGVVLFIMVVGSAPFRWAHPTDERYAHISSGRLATVVKGLGISMSPEVCDLLQGFFWAEMQKRFNLADIVQHPWVQGKPLEDQQLQELSDAKPLPDKPKLSVSSQSMFLFDAYHIKNRMRNTKRS